MAAKRIEPEGSCSKKRAGQVTVRYIKPLFVKTDEANFKAVVQSLTGQDSDTNSFPTSHENGFLQGKENVPVVPVKEMAFNGGESSCVPSFNMGFETGTIDSLNADLLLQKDAFELPPLTISDIDMSWDSFPWSEY
ncbi:hypothetical protein SUGI_0329140 [Cryptomeria japonica]|nr:hypothetical protein SUGI_0329140 [Cryptomeria japonica]